MRFFCAPDKNAQFKSSGLECCTTFEVSHHNPVQSKVHFPLVDRNPNTYNLTVE